MEHSYLKSARKPITYGLAAAGVAICLLSAYALGAFDFESREHIQAEDVCSNLPDKQAAADFFNSALPSASHYSFHQASTSTHDFYFVINCEVMGDHGKRLVDLNAEMVATIPWERWEKELLPPTTGGKVKNFVAGTMGASAPRRAGIFVPCYASDKLSKEADSLSVFAVALEPFPGSEKKIRQQLVDQALSLAKFAHKQAQCDLPSSLPGEATAPGE